MSRYDQRVTRLLDLFCGAGGASFGYHRAGFDEIVGVDHVAQPDYPFEFVRADAVEYALAHAHEYDAVHASPPCQSQTALTKGTNRGRQYPNYIPQIRSALSRLNVPTVIENVQGSSLRRDLVLCGEMFDLSVLRHRYFEIENFTVPTPKHPPHRGRVRGWRHGVYYDGPYLAVYGDGGGKGSVSEWQEAMDIFWTSNRLSIAEAIPPAFTKFIGSYMIEFCDTIV